MKKLWLIIVIFVISASITGIMLHDKIEDKMADIGFDWYENRNDSTIKTANEFAKERLEKKYHVFLNGIKIDIAYEWDGFIYVPIRSIGESLNWAVNWLPELNLIQLLKGNDEAYVEIINLFGKAYIELDRMENLLRLQDISLHGGNIDIITAANRINSLHFNKLLRYNFYINEMKMTDRAIAYQGKKYVPSRILALSLGETFRYDAELGSASISSQKINCIFVDGEAYSTLEDIQDLVAFSESEFRFEDFKINDDELWPVITKGKNGKLAALTFDDYLGDNVNQLLDVLAEYNIKATFFVIGNSIEPHSETFKRVIEDGHLPANHTWDHLNCHSLTDDEIRAQLISTQLKIQQYSGTMSPYFRPPGGYYDNRILRIAQDIGLQTVLWSVNSTDADTRNRPEDIEAIVKRRVSPGSIVVMHLNRETTIEALPGIIKNLRNKGYRFVTVDELIGLQEEN